MRTVRRWLRIIGAVAGGLFGGWVASFIVTRLLSRLLFPGFSGQLELATNHGDRTMLVVIYLAGWAVSAWFIARLLRRRLAS
jgi:cytochrome c biogenesis protein CcdA